MEFNSIQAVFLIGAISGVSLILAKYFMEIVFNTMNYFLVRASHRTSGK
jgi:hypothetical protein